MKIDLRKKDIIWSYIGTFMSMFSNILMIPIIVFFLDSEMLGLWYIFTSIGAMTALFDFGFSTTFARNITYCWSGAHRLYKNKVEITENREPDYGLLKNILYSCKKIYFLIAVGALCLLVTVGTFYIAYITNKSNDTGYFISWAIYVLAIFLNLYYGYYISFLRGVGAIALVNKNIAYARIIQVIITIMLLFAETGLIAPCVGYLIYGFVFRYLCKKEFYKYQMIGEKIKDVKNDKVVSKEIFGVVWHNAWRDGVVSFSNYFSDQAMVIVCSLFLTLSQTAAYSLGVQIAAAIGIIASIQYTAQQPAIQAAYVSRDNNKLKIIMSQIVGVLIILFILLSALTVFIVLPILEFIKPEIKIARDFFIALCFYQFLLRLRNCYTSYFSCTNRIPYIRSFIISSMLAVLGSILLLKFTNVGIWGIIVAQIISQCIFNIWYWPQKVHKELHTDFGSMLYMFFDKVKKYT